MECENCKATIDDKSSFCGKCGHKAKGDLYGIEGMLKNCQRFWYVVGLYRGVCRGEKDNESLKKFESLLKESDIIDDYYETVSFWEDKLKEIAMKNGAKQ